MGFVRPYESRAESLADVLGADFSRPLMAKAWRHCRRIDPKKARQIWLMVRRREGRCLPKTIREAA